VIVLGMRAGHKFATEHHRLRDCDLYPAPAVSTLSFGSRHRYDLILNLHWAAPFRTGVAARLLRRHSLRAHCASQRSPGGYEGTDLSYRVLLRDSNRLDDLLHELRDVEGVSRVTSLKAEEESEL
jgi:hypothetical protein